MNFRIVRYHPTDHPALLLFLHEVWTDLGRTLDLTTKDPDLANVETVYQSNHGTFLLAKLHNHILGTIALRQLTPTIGELKRLYVHKNHRHQGIGTTLLQAAITHAKSTPWQALRLDTGSNTPAAALFQKHNFYPIPRYNNDPYADLFLELSLLTSGSS